MCCQLLGSARRGERAFGPKGPAVVSIEEDPLKHRSKTGRFGLGLVRGVAVALMFATTLAAQAQQSRNLAPGFTTLPKEAKVVFAPLDVELFSISAGGLTEPKADWTEAAKRHMKTALQGRARAMNLGWTEIDDKTADEHAELLNLHNAVAEAIATHHVAFPRLPTKEDRLEWSFGDTLRPLQQATGARYGLFTFVRDSYATAERKAMMGVVAVLSVVATGGASVVVLSGGSQAGYATLVDLETGQVLWFNRLLSATGDMREAAPASESVDALLAGFPAAK